MTFTVFLVKICFLSNHKVTLINIAYEFKILYNSLPV